MEKTGKMFPPVVSPALRDALIPAINSLDANTRSRLSLTCREMSRACLHAKAIKLDLRGSEVEVRVDSMDRPVLSFSIHRRRVLNDTELSNFQRMQFNVYIQTIVFHSNIDQNLLSVTREFLGNVKVKTIREIWLREASCWKELNMFIQDFMLKDVFVNTNQNIPVDVLHSLLQEQKLVSFTYWNDVPDRLIVASPVKTVILNGAPVHSVTFNALLKTWLENNSLDTWDIGCSMDDDEFSRCFHRYVRVDYNGRGPLPRVRPLVLTDDEARQMVVIRDDNTSFKCLLFHSFVTFMRLSTPWV